MLLCKIARLAACLFVLTLAGAWGASPAKAQEAVPAVPVPGMVTMVDLGAKNCIPCRMMAPILVELEKEYQGRAAIVFIDVWQHHDQVERFGLRAIPTQIFFDKEGREVKRHTGFLSKEAIEAELKRLGVE